MERISKEELASIKAPILIAVGDRDFARVEHAAEAATLIPGAVLAVIPDASHFVLFSEPNRVIPVVKDFLEKPTTDPRWQRRAPTIIPVKPDEGRPTIWESPAQTVCKSYHAGVKKQYHPNLCSRESGFVSSSP